MLSLVTFVVFAQEIVRDSYFTVSKYGDLIEVKTSDPNADKLPGSSEVGDKCGCYPGDSLTSTLLGSCCWTEPSVTAPTCHSAAGTGRSCI